MSTLEDGPKNYLCPYCNSCDVAFIAHGVAGAVFEECEIVGGGFRNNAECPNCGALDRDRLVLIYLRLHTAVFATAPRVLHVAPEDHLAKQLKISARVYLSIDIQPHTALMDAMLQADVRSMPFPDNSFDLVVCNHVLEHIDDDATALAELFRVTSQNGIAILQVPIGLKLAKTREGLAASTPADRERLYGQDDHVRIYGMDYRERLERAGFTVDVYDPNNDPVPGLCEKYALIPNERLYIGIKA
jgi:SAM-dependent methyltransferase